MIAFTNAPAHDKPLLDYFETDFIQGSPGRSKRYLCEHRCSVHYIDSFVKPGILIGQIDDVVLDLFQSRLVERGFRDSMTQLHRYRVRVVVRHRASSALPRRRLHGLRSLLGSDVDWEDESLLGVVFEIRFKVDHAGRMIRKSTQRRYQGAVDRFLHFAGESVELNGIDEGRLAAFERSCLEGRMTRYSARRTMLLIRAIVEAYGSVQPAEGSARRLLALAPNLAKETIDHYRIAVGVLSKFLEREAKVTDLNRETIGRFTTYWIETKGRSIVTADDHRRRLNRLARFAIRLGLLGRADPLPPLIGAAAARNKILPDDVRLGFVKCYFKGKEIN